MRKLVALALAIVAWAYQANAEVACTAPTSWPLGHHSHTFYKWDQSTVADVAGWDPAHETGTNQTNKDTLTALVDTYPVGLPNGMEPADLPRDWTGTTTWTPANLAALGLPTVSLTGVSGTVYLVDGYDGLTNPKTIDLSGGVKVAVSRSAFRMFNHAGGASTLILIDSLIKKGPDNGNDGLLNGQQTPTCSPLWCWWSAYSEIIGGQDAAKIKWQAFYRDHLHGATKSPASAHIDGVQSAGDEPVFLFENNVDAQFRHANGGIFMGGGSTKTAKTYLMNNLVGGGNRSFNWDAGTHANTHVCGNRVLATNTMGSWTLSPGGRTGNSFYNNRSVTGHTSGTDSYSGNAWDWTNTTQTPDSVQDEADAEVTKIETWVSEIRAEAGYSVGDPPDPGDDPMTLTHSCSGASGNAPLTGVDCITTATEGTSTGPDYKVEMDCTTDGTAEASFGYDNASPDSSNWASTACNGQYVTAGTYINTATIYDKGNNGPNGATVGSPVTDDVVITVTTPATYEFSPAAVCTPSNIISGDNVTCTFATVNPVGAQTCNIDNDGDEAFDDGVVTTPHVFALSAADGAVVDINIQCTSAGAAPSETIETGDLLLTVSVQTGVAIDAVDLCRNGTGLDCTSAPEGQLVAGWDSATSRVINLDSIQKSCVDPTTGYGTATACSIDGDCTGDDTCRACLTLRVDGNAALDADEGSLGFTLTRAGDRGTIERPASPTSLTLGVECDPNEADCGFPTTGDNASKYSWSETSGPYGFPQEPGLSSANGPMCSAELTTPGIWSLSIDAFTNQDVTGTILDTVVINYEVTGGTTASGHSNRGSSRH